VAQFSNYTDLTASVTSFNWARDSGSVADFIYITHMKLMQMLRIPALEKTATITIDTSAETAPADLMQVKRIWVDGSYDQPLVSQPSGLLQSIRGAYKTAAEPRWFCLEGLDETTDVLQFAPTPDQAYTGYLLYYQRLPFFASGAATNKILARYPYLYLYGALAEAARFSDDTSRIAQFERLFVGALSDIIVSARADQTGGGSLLPSSPYTT